MLRRFLSNRISDRFQKVEVIPNRRTLGAKCRQDLPAVLQGFAEGDSESMLAGIKSGNLVISGYEITEDIELRRVEREGFAAQTVQIADSSVSLVLDKDHDTPELLSKGLARDITRRVQSARKDLNLQIEDTINLTVCVANAPELFDEDKSWIFERRRANSALSCPEMKA